MAYFTETELLERYEYFAIQLEQRLLDGEDYKNLIDQIPAMALVSRTEDVDIIYTNEAHQGCSGYSLEEIREGCSDYLNNVIHPKSLEYVRNFLPHFYKSNNGNTFRTTSFLQYARINGRSDYAPLITFAKPTRVTDGLTLRMPMQLDELEKLSPKIEQVVRMDLFRLEHFRKFQTLTEREIEILKLLANGKNNSEISDQLFLSRQTVETHRKNLKRKLELTSFLDLMRYAFAFDLVE